MKKTTLFLFSLFLTIGAMAQDFLVKNKVTEVNTGYYVVVGTFNPGNGGDTSTGPAYYDNSLGGCKYRLDVDKTIAAGESLPDLNYVWYVENNGATITLKNMQDEVYFVRDNARNENFIGSETANLTLKSVSQDASKFFMYLADYTNVGYIHCNAPGGDPCLSYWDSYAESRSTAVRFEFFEVEELHEYVYNTGTSVHSERKLNSFTITDGTNSLNVTSIQPVVGSPIYVDKSDQKLTTKAGSTLYFSAFNWSGSWMHAYAYIDYNKDYKFTLTNNNNGEGEGEIVSYNYYEGKTITGGAGNTNGNALAPDTDYDGSKAMPAFTLPANLQAGEYRMRIKIDWNNLDADYGDTSLVGGTGANKNNQKIVDNGGCQCDITIVVESSEPRRVSVVAGDGGSVTIEGETGTEVEVAGNVNIIATPDYGYEFVNWKKGDEVVSTAASYVYNGAEEANFVAEFRRLTIDEQYSLLSQPTFKLSDGNITEISQIEFNGSNMTGFQTALGTTKHLNDVIKVRAGGTYKLTIGYELHWGDIALYQIDNNGTQTKYGPYLCAWEANADPLNILKRDNSTMYEDFGLNSLDDFEVVSSGGNTYMWLPYEISIDEDHKPGDLVTLRIVAATPKAATASEDYTQGRCFDILLEVVPTYPLSVSAAGWASLYLDFPAEIPDFGNEDEEAGVYIVTGVKEGNWLNLVKVTDGVLPANTGVIVKAAQGTYEFKYSAEDAADVSANILKGTVKDEYIEGKAYVLGNKSGIGFYQALLNFDATYNKITNEANIEQYGVYFKNNAYKSYLLATDIPATLSRSAGFRFSFGGTTAIEEVEVENEKVNEAIYDLAGRRLNEITKPGIYIINGKKVLVK